MKLTKEYLKTLDIERIKNEVLIEYFKCVKNPKYCIENYFSVEVKGGIRIPFKLYPHQVETLYSYERYTVNISMKSRRMGFTTFTAAYIAYKMITNNNFKVIVISKTATDSKKIIGEIKDILNEVIRNFPWLCSGYDPSENNKMSFKLLNGSQCEGGSASEDYVRGRTIDFLFIDEISFIDRRTPTKMEDIWTAAGPALSTRKGKSVLISTPKGSSGFYYESYTNAHKKGFHVIHAHWSVHPEFNKGMYQWISDETRENGGYVKFFNKEWPEDIEDIKSGERKVISKRKYKFIKDGRKRSPWYDAESTKLGPTRTKCELDCSFMGTGGEVLDSDLLREIKESVDNSKYKKYTTPFEHINAIFKEYKEYIPYNINRRYALSADVATGDGSDYSAFSIIDIDSLEVCATFKAQLLPHTFAKIIYLAGKRYGKCPVIVENAGGGGTTLQSLKEMGYPNIYYSTLRKNDPSTGLKKRKIGLWPSEQVRWEGGDRLEQVLRNKQLKFHCKDIVVELYTWIWDKDGKRRHAPGKNDDLLMALQHGIYYIYYVIRRSDRKRIIYNQLVGIEEKNKAISTDETNTGKENFRGRIARSTRLQLMATMKDQKNISIGNIENMI